MRALGDEAADVALAGDVRPDEARAFERALGLGAGLGITSAEGHAQPVGEQALDDGATDTATSSRDKSDARDIITLSMDVEIVSEGDELGEGPVWLEREQALSRVDIHGASIVLRDPATGHERRRRLAGHVGFALPTASGATVAGVERSLVALAHLDAEGVPLASVEPEHSGNRFNDAACDPHGRLWVGTMARDRRPGAAALYRYVAGSRPEVAIAGATISNGLDWSLDATRLYYIDSTTQRIDAIDFDVDAGRLGRRRAFATIDPGDGLPDGLCVDAEGGVWIALFGGGAIRRYDPRGALDAQIALPVTNPTSLAFGGPGLRDLYVTSARHRLTGEQLAREPAAGALLRLRPGVQGRPSWRFAD